MAGGRVAMLPVAALMAAALTACTPEMTGYTGISVDAAGRASAEVVWCGPDRPASIMLFRADEDDTPPTPWPEWPGRDYPLPPEAASPATVALPDFPTAPSATLFSMYAAAETTTRRVTFTPGELALVPPGSVLITAVEDGEDRQRTVSRAEFAGLADGMC